MSEWICKLYDVDGKEIVLKPGHSLVCSKESCTEVAIDEYEIKMTYKLGSGHLESKLKSVAEEAWKITLGLANSGNTVKLEEDNT
jgi:hypothetical protein